MDFSYSDEQELLIESIKDFCERNLTEQSINEMYDCLLYTSDAADEL